MQTEQLSQSQMFWHMAFNDKLNAVTCSEVSLSYWHNEKERLSRSKRENILELKERAERKVEEVSKAVSDARFELQEWVKTHPYPTA